MDGKMLWRTAGYITIGLGLYMIYRGSDDTVIFERDDNILDAEFTIIDE